MTHTSPTPPAAVIDSPSKGSADIVASTGTTAVIIDAASCLQEVLHEI